MGIPSVLDDVFESFVNGARLFKDREVLRHDYLPEKLPHREDQIRLLGATVAPVLRNSRCSNIFIYGKTGTGKTAVTKYVLSHLETKAKEYGAKVQFCYINCLGTVLDQEGIAVRTGHHCAQPVMDRFGVPATARASLAFYNTKQEINALAGGLERVKAMFG